MTASDDPAGPADSGSETADADPSLGDRAMDLLVYAPAGAVLTVLDDVPELASKGRARLQQDLRNAQVIGRFAVQIGWRELRHQLETLAGEWPVNVRPWRQQPVGRTAPVTPGQPPAPAPRDVAGTHTARRGMSGPAAGTAAGRNPAVDRAIPDYDTLSASQVVRRLDGLGPDDLRAVMRHELATRGRRTIVHRAQQLLGIAEPPGAPTVS